MPKLGLNPLRYDAKAHSRLMITRTALDELGPAPTMSPGYSALADQQLQGNWLLEGNADYGDCVFADIAHRTMLWTAQGSGTMLVPTEQQTLALYSAVTGFDPNDPSTDNGSDLVTAAQYVQDHGFLTHTEAAHGLIDPSNLDHIKWAVTLFGCCPLGIECPDSAQVQFSKGEPWDVVSGSSIEGGHDVLCVEYQPDEPCWLLATWGKRWPATTRFVQKYLFNCVPVVSKDFVNPSGITGSGITLDRMLTLLGALT